MSSITPRTSLNVPSTTSSNKLTFSIFTEPTSPVSPLSNTLNLSFSEDLSSLTAKFNSLSEKFISIDNRMTHLENQIEKIAFLTNYLTKFPSDHFYACGKCQKWRYIFFEKQVRRIQTGAACGFNVFCPSCKTPSPFGPNPDMKALKRLLLEQDILMPTPKEQKVQQ